MGVGTIFSSSDDHYTGKKMVCIVGIPLLNSVQACMMPILSAAGAANIAIG